MKHLLSGISLLLSLLIVSCRPDGVDGEVLMQFTDIATYEGSDTPWGGALFSLRQENDLPEVQLTCDYALSDTYSKGDRMYILYTIDSNQPYTSGKINLLGLSKITQGKLAELADGEEWNADPVFVYSIWRTGDYLNFHIRLPYSEEPRRFYLGADPATLLNEWPDLYLVHDIPDDVAVYFDRSYYASYDISAIWAGECKGVRVHVENSNLDKKIFTFSKSVDDDT